MDDTEKRWITAAMINKDTKYFGYLVKEHQLTVRGYLRRLTKGDEALSDDLAQETFLNAYRKISGYNNTGTFKSWLLSIAYRCFLMHIRKNSGNPLMNFPLNDYDADDIDGPEVSSKYSDRVTNKIDLENAFRLLKKNERSVLTLCYSYGMSHSEISEIMDMPLGTVKSHILRGKEALKKILSPAEEKMLC